MILTLVLSKAYLPERIISQERALGMIFSGRILNILEHDGQELGRIPYRRISEFKYVARSFQRSSNDSLGDLIIYGPSVIISNTRSYHYRREVSFNRSNVYKRDRFKCQYCGRIRNNSDLNYDHVIPRSSGGRTCWDNIVTSCYSCNIKKGCRTPEQAGMFLIRKPFRPSWSDILFHDIATNSIDKLWIPYMGYCE